MSEKNKDFDKLAADASKEVLTNNEKNQSVLDASRTILSSITKELIKQVEQNVSAYSIATQQVALCTQEVAMLRRKFDTQQKAFNLSSAEAKRLEDSLKLEKESSRVLMEEQMLIRAKMADEYQLSKLSSEQKKSMVERSGILAGQISAMHEASIQIAAQLNVKKKIAESDRAALVDTWKLLDVTREELNVQLELQKTAKAQAIAAGFKLAKDGIYAAVDGAEELESVIKSIASSPLLAVVQLIKLAFERFVKLDKAAEDFRRTTGLTIRQTSELRKSAEALNASYQDMGVGIDEAYKATVALVEAFGGMALAGSESAKTTALLSANLGVAAENTADVLSKFEGLGGLTETVANNMIKAGAAMTKGTPVSFAKVMEDIAKSSDEVQHLLGNNPQILMKTAIAARALGTSINALAAMSKKLLDFQSSINNEMEASALLGVSLNFQRARQLSFDGKLADAAKETLRVVKSAGEWNKMSVFQREALAKASGMELKDMNKMVALDRIRSSGSKEGEKLKLLDKQLNTMSKINMETDAKLVADAEDEIKQRQMQAVMTDIGNMMKSIFVELANVLAPVVKVLVTVIVPILKTIGLFVKLIGTLLSPIGEAFEWINDNVGSLSGGLDKVSGYLDSVKKTLSFGNSELKGWAKTGAVLLGILLAAASAWALIAARKKLASAAGGVTGFLGKGMGKPLPDAGKGLAGKTAGGLSGKMMDGLGDGLGKLAGAAGKGIQGILTGLAKGISALGSPKVFLGALAMAALGASIIPLAIALKMFSDIDWSSIWKAGIVLVALAAAAFGLSFIAPAIIIGSIAIAALGISLIPFAAAAWLAGKASQELAKGMSMAVAPLKELADIGVANLVGAAAGIYAVSAALAAFGAGSAMSGIGALVGKLAGGDPVKKLRQLADLGNDLSKTAAAIQSINGAFAGFNEVDKFASSISNLADTMDKLNKSISSISLLSMAKLTAAVAMSPRVSDANVPTGSPASETTVTPANNTDTKTNTAIIGKLQELIDLFHNGGIAVNLDGRKVSAALTNVGR